MDTTNNKTVFLNRTAMEWFSSLPVMFLLVLTLVIGTGEMIHGQLLRMGENMFGNPSTGVQYFMMRVDPQTPDCDPNMDIDQAVQAQLSSSAASDDPDNESSIVVLVLLALFSGRDRAASFGLRRHWHTAW